MVLDILLEIQLRKWGLSRKYKYIGPLINGSHTDIQGDSQQENQYPYSVTERANRTIQEHATAMLYEAGLPPSFLSEAVDAYVTVQNKCPTNSLSGKTPFELWYKQKPDVSNLRIWGCSAYVHIQKEKHTGIGSHMEKCIFIGYPEGYKAWKFYNPLTRCVVISERAEFDE